MNKYERAAGASEKFNQSDASHAAEAIRRDFHQLVAIFERQLGSVNQDDQSTQSHISEAKRAAERGLELVEGLVKLLRASP
jgi:hypothetical protein